MNEKRLYYAEEIGERMAEDLIFSDFIRNSFLWCSYSAVFDEKGEFCVDARFTGMKPDFEKLLELCEEHYEKSS